MKRKYKLKKRAKNPFTKITGIPAIELGNDLNCLIVDQDRITSIPNLINKSTITKTVAAYIYIRHPQILAEYGYEPLLPSINEYTFEIEEIMRVKQTCGFRKCVNPSHLEVKVKQSEGWSWN